MTRSHDQPIEKTLEIWQPRSTRKLSDEDAREIRENTVGFFRILGEWQAKDNGVAKEGDESAAGDDLPAGKVVAPSKRLDG